MRDIEKKRAAWSAWYQRNREKYNAYSVIKKRNNRAKTVEWFTIKQSALRCLHCQEPDIACLDFHHVNPAEKDYPVSKMLSGFSQAHIEVEMQKCVVLCANCNRKEHQKKKEKMGLPGFEPGPQDPKS